VRKRIYIIHGWDGYPEEGWFPWIKKELNGMGFETSVPAMPHPDHPTIDDWVGAMQTLINEPDERTYFIGHSIGCQTILRYIADLPISTQIGGVVMVGPWLTLSNVEDTATAEPWLSTPINFENVRKHTQKIEAIFSDNDPYVPLENVRLFEKNLECKTSILHGKKHFSGSDGITVLPEAVHKIIAMTAIK
jgi:predicted alpha/beta hydrolase family esterase